MKSLRSIFRLLPASIRTLVTQSYFALNGWRSDEFKKWRSEARPNDFIVQESYNRLSASENQNRLPKIAIVSPTPPADTGISNCTIQTYRHSEFEIDIYSSFATSSDYLGAVYAPEIENSRTKIFALDTLSYGCSVNDYKAVVFTLGSSPHNLPYMLALLKLATRSSDIRIYVHLHDPVIFNLLRFTCFATGKDFIGQLETFYGRLSFAERLRAKNKDYSFLLNRGFCGISALFGGIGLNAIIVNSEAAKKLLETELENCAGRDSPISIKQLFHPIFPAPDTSVSEARLKHIRIGTFGLPDKAKRTELVVEAFRLLRKSMPDAELIIAGYGTKRYSELCNLNASEGIVILDGPSDLDLQRAMRSCHLGVQLRDKNTGESSGVVSQLLANQVPVLVSSIGAFTEYGDAVGYVAADASPADLLRSILDELRAGGRRDEAVKRLVAERDPAHFCEELLKLVSASTLHLVHDKKSAGRAP